MDYEDEVVSFLSSKENLLVSWEICEKFQRIKEKLLMDFWGSILENVNGHTKTFGSWSYRLKDEKSPLKNGYGFAITLPNPPSKNLFLEMSLSQEWHYGGMQLYYGISWRNAFEENPQLTIPELANLKDALQESGYNTTELNWGIGWKWADYWGMTKDFCVRVAENKEEFAAEVVGLIWQVFIKYKEEIEQINRIIAEREIENNQVP